MEQAQCKGMLACEEGAVPCCTPLSLGAARFMSNTELDCAAPGRPQDSVGMWSPSPVSPTLH